MAKRSSLDVAFFLVDGRNLLGYSTELSDEVESLMQDAGGLDAAWPTPVATGAQQAAFKQNGWYDDATNATHSVLSGQQGTSRNLAYAFNGNVIGRAYSAFAGAFGAKYRRVVTKNELHRANADYTISGQADEGVILHELSAETADGNTEADSVDHGAATANGGAAHLHVTALSLGGHTNLTVKGRHSVDDVSFVDLVTMTALTQAAFDAGTRAERKPLAGDVYRYLACAWDFTGAGSGPTATFFFGVSRD